MLNFLSVHRRVIVLSFAIAAAAIAAATASAEPRLPGFKTPSGNIVCGFAGGSLRCDIRTGVRPLPRRPRDCTVDWGQGVSLGKAGRASIVCAGDTVLGLEVPTLRYGRTWRQGGIRCVSRSTGLTCRNSSGRGFFLSRERTRLF